MKTCKVCSYKNIKSAIYCYNCGRNLSENPSYRKIVLLSIIFLILLFIGLYIYKLINVKTPAEKFLPENTFQLYEFYDLEKTINAFMNTHEAKILKSINLKKLTTDLDIPKPVTEIFNSYISYIRSFDTDLLYNLFGTYTAVGLIPDEFNSLEANFSNFYKKIVSGFVIITRPKYGGDILNFIRKFVPLLKKHQSVEYNNHNIYWFESNLKNKIYYCIIDGLLITGFTQDAIIKCLDTQKKQVMSLSNNPLYQKLRNKNKSKNLKLFTYSNISVIYKHLLNLLRQKVKDKQELNIFYDYYKHLSKDNAFSYSISFHNNMIKTSSAYFVQKKLNVQLSKNKTLGWIPENSLFYFCYNAFNLSELRDLFNNEKFKRFFQMFNIKIDRAKIVELFEIVNGQLSIILTDVISEKFLPAPQLTLLLRIKNKETMKKIINELTPQYLVPAQEEHNIYKISYFNIPYLSNISPSYSFINDYFLISLNYQCIKDIINTKESIDINIMNNNLFKKIYHKFSKNDNIVMFINVSDSIEKIRKIINWLTSISALFDITLASKVDIVRKELIFPFLNISKRCKAYGMHVNYSDNSIVSNSYIYLHND